MKQEDFARLKAIFERRDDDGERVYGDEEVRPFIPLLYFAAGAAAPPKGGAMAGTLQTFAAEAGLLPELSPEDRRERLAGWLEENPLNPALAGEVHAFVVDLGAEGKSAAQLLSSTFPALKRKRK